jgi:hypothetical protein
MIQADVTDVDDAGAEEANDIDAEFAAGIARYEAIYHSEGISSSPRIEMVFALVVTGVAFGLIVAILFRTLHLSADFEWVSLWFLGALIYHLFQPMACNAIMVDEVLFRYSHWRGEPVSPVRAKKHRMRILREFISIGTVVLAVGLIAWGAVSLTDWCFPIERLRAFTAARAARVRSLICGLPLQR